MKIPATSIQDLINRSGDHKDRMIELEKFISETVPELDKKFYDSPSISMIGWGEMPYKDGTWPLIALAPQKNTVNIYVSAIKNKKYILEVYNGKLGKVSCGKSCARIKKIEDLNLDEWKKMLRDAVSYYDDTVLCMNK